jgi:hypothetical protein
VSRWTGFNWSISKLDRLYNGNKVSNSLLLNGLVLNKNHAIDLPPVNPLIIFIYLTAMNKDLLESGGFRGKVLSYSVDERLLSVKRDRMKGIINDSRCSKQIVLKKKKE